MVPAIGIPKVKYGAIGAVATSANNPSNIIFRLKAIGQVKNKRKIRGNSRGDEREANHEKREQRNAGGMFCSGIAGKERMLGP